MNRQRRGRRKPNSSGRGQSGESKIPSSHKSSRKRGKNSNRKNKGSKQKQTKRVGSGGHDTVAPSPILALKKIPSSSPVGSGLNPFAGDFLSDKADGQKTGAPTFFKVLFYDSFKDAKESAGVIKGNCSGCDQLNVVIKAEGNMDDPDLLSIDGKVKVFAGEAWTLIHKRRSEDGWYDSAQ